MSLPSFKVQMEMQTGAQMLTIRINSLIFTCPVASRRLVFVSRGDAVFCGVSMSCCATAAALISAPQPAFLSLVQMHRPLLNAARPALIIRFRSTRGVQSRPEPVLFLCHLPPSCNCILTMTTYQ